MTSLPADPTAADFLVPVADDETQPFWDAAARGELRMQACGSCCRLRFPPRSMCPWCHSTERAWEPVSGRGTIWSFAVPHPPLLPAYGALAPYAVVVVALDDDPSLRLVGNLVARPDGPINEIDPATVEIGTAVEVVFTRAAGDVAVPRWRLS